MLAKCQTLDLFQFAERKYVEKSAITTVLHTIVILEHKKPLQGCSLLTLIHQSTQPPVQMTQPCTKHIMQIYFGILKQIMLCTLDLADTIHPPSSTTSQGYVLSPSLITFSYTAAVFPYRLISLSILLMTAQCLG